MKSAVTLIHNYIYKEIILLTAAIIGVLTFLLVAVNMVKVIELIMYTDLPMYLTLKFMVLVIPLTLTITIPPGLLAAVMIVFGRNVVRPRTPRPQGHRHRPRPHRRPPSLSSPCS